MLIGLPTSDQFRDWSAAQLLEALGLSLATPIVRVPWAAYGRMRAIAEQADHWGLVSLAKCWIEDDRIVLLAGPEGRAAWRKLCYNELSSKDLPIAGEPRLALVRGAQP